MLLEREDIGLSQEDVVATAATLIKTAGTGLFLFQTMCMGSTLSSNPTSIACEDQRLIRTSFKATFSSEDFK